jgi:cyclohexanone monooxygenase
MPRIMTNANAQEPQYDAIVIGGGITGIYQAYRLRELGFSVRGLEAGSDVGGTWYWNRYPGCRLDTESYAYGYFCLTDILPDWRWSERFAGQPEILSYVNAAADRMDIRKDYRFGVKVERAAYDVAANLWRLHLSDGAQLTCRFLLTAVGPLSAVRMPPFEGIGAFKGQSFHSSDWPRDPNGGFGPGVTDFTGKRVGVIGTGATGVQIIPEVARTATELYVFQRSPNWCTPLGNHPLTPERMDFIRQNQDNLLAYLKTTDAAFPYHRPRRKGVDTTPEERQAFFEQLYNAPGYGIWLSSYSDLLLSRESNGYLADFIADKIRGRVVDQAVAEKLIPKDHPFGAKRVPMESGYYEVFNQDNVHLVDIRESPIERISADGIVTRDASYDLDVIIYATGFDGVTGAFERMDIIGRDGVSLNEAWADGPLTYLGLQTAGFPNFFTLVGAHNGAAFCNIGVCGGLQVDWITKLLRDMRNRGHDYCEPDAAAQQEWTENVYRDFARTLMRDAAAWWVKITTNPDGTETRRALVYVGGGPEYRKLCDQIAFHDYEGFVMSKAG